MISTFDSKKPFFAALFFLMAMTLFVFSVNAQDSALVDDVPELAAVEFEPEEDFQKKTRFIEFKSELDPAFSHSFNLPKDWTNNLAFADIDSNRKVTNKKVLLTMARYNSPVDEEHDISFVTVDAMELEYQIGIKNWFFNYVLLNGLSLQGMNVIDEGKRELEAVYVEVQRDTTYVVRSKAFINGKKVIIIRYYTPMELYQKNKVFIAQVLNSFNLTQKFETPIEQIKEYGFLNQAYFKYPASWKLIAQPVLSIEEMKALLHRNRTDNKLEGQMNIKVYNKYSYPDKRSVIKSFRDEFEVKNYEIGRFIEDVDINYHRHMNSGSTQVYELNPVRNNLIRYELWVSISETDEYIFLNYMITPSRNEEFYTWSRNSESFYLVVESMRVHEPPNALYEYLE